MIEINYPCFSILTLDMPKFMLWGAILLAAVIAGGACLLLIRRKFGPGAEMRTDTTAFEMDSLESMRDSGQISLEEYRVLRRKVLKLDGEPGGVDNAASSRGGNGDDESKTGEAQGG